MNDVKIILEACASIWRYKVDLLGYDVSLMNIFVFGCLCVLCFKVISWVT